MVEVQDKCFFHADLIDRINERFELGETRMNDHSERIRSTEKIGIQMMERFNFLVKRIDLLTKILVSVSGGTLVIFVTFFIWYVQRLPG